MGREARAEDTCVSTAALMVLRVTSSGKGALLAGVRDTRAGGLVTDWSAESEEDPAGEAIVNRRHLRLILRNRTETNANNTEQLFQALRNEVTAPCTGASGARVLR